MIPTKQVVKTKNMSGMTNQESSMKSSNIYQTSIKSGIVAKYLIAMVIHNFSLDGLIMNGMMKEEAILALYVKDGFAQK